MVEMTKYDTAPECCCLGVAATRCEWGSSRYQTCSSSSKLAHFLWMSKLSKFGVFEQLREPPAARSPWTSLPAPLLVGEGSQSTAQWRRPQLLLVPVPLCSQGRCASFVWPSLPFKGLGGEGG